MKKISEMTEEEFDSMDESELLESLFNSDMERKEEKMSKKLLVKIVVVEEEFDQVRKLDEIFPNSDFTISEIEESDNHFLENLYEMAKLKIENAIKFVSSVVF